MGPLDPLGRESTGISYILKTKPQNKLTEAVTESGLENKSVFSLWLDLQDS